MRRHRLTRVANALAEQQRANEASDAGVDMHNRAAGKVEGAETREVPRAIGDFVKLGLRGSLGGGVGAGGSQRLGGGGQIIRRGNPPDRMRDREVNDRDPQRDEDQHGGKPHALGKGADDQGRRDAGEGHLKRHIGIFRNNDAIGEGGGIRFSRNAAQKALRQAANKGVERATV